MVVNLEMEDFFADEEDEVLVGVEELDNEEEELDGLDDLEDLDESLEVVEDDSSELVEGFGVSSEEELEPTDEEPEQPKEVVNTVERYSSTELAYPSFLNISSVVLPK